MTNVYELTADQRKKRRREILQQSVTLYRVSLTNPDTLLYAGASWEHVRREIRDYRVLREAGLIQDRELIVTPKGEEP